MNSYCSHPTHSYIPQCCCYCNIKHRTGSSKPHKFTRCMVCNLIKLQSSCLASLKYYQYKTTDTAFFIAEYNYTVIAIPCHTKILVHRPVQCTQKCLTKNSKAHKDLQRLIINLSVYMCCRYVCGRYLITSRVS